MNAALRLYSRIILQHPLMVILLVLFVCGYLGYRIKDFELEASPDSLIAEKSEGLRYYRQLQFKYGGQSDDFFFVTFTPASGSVFTEHNLSVLDRLSRDIQKLDRVKGVLSILDVPLFKNPPGGVEDLAKNLKTLRDPDVDVELARQEFKQSPLYKELLVSADLATTALSIDFEENEQAQELLQRRTRLREKKYTQGLAAADVKELENVSASYEGYKEELRQKQHESLEKIRQIVDGYRDEGTIHLGGASMLSSDLISYIRRDIKVFGAGMFVFLVITLWFIFRRKRWVILPITCCVLSVVAMMGLLGITGWNVTIVSSNFISLQLIMTMALSIHLIVRYTEILEANPQTERKFLARETVRTIFIPCLYTVLTTIAGFSSLVFSGILPVIHFGWMMTMGLSVSLVITFLFFPSAEMLLGKTTAHQGQAHYVRVMAFLARFTERRRTLIFGVSGVLLVVIGVGIFMLKVENSFINYFAKSTEVYQGMKFVDRNLGGTTPLHVVIDFADKPQQQDDAGNAQDSPETGAGDEDEDFAAFEDFSEPASSDSADVYWYTQDKIQTIREVHSYLDGLEPVGKVLSVDTMLQIARDLLDQESLDNFDLALLFKKLPDEFKDMAVHPFVLKEDNEARIVLRVMDSLPNLNRHQLLAQIRNDLEHKLDIDPSNYRLAGPMVLYSQTLQSLYKSQMQTAGVTILALMVMFLCLFRSFKISVIALLPNLLASFSVLGVMGILGIPLDIMTITIVAISIGIAVDNTIHYIHRFRREFEQQQQYLAVMHHCHCTVGLALFYISITIVVGFSILTASNFIPTVLFGLFTSLAIFIAVTASLTLLPRLIILTQPFGKEQ